MADIKRIQDAVTEFYSSSSDAVRTIRSGIDSLAIAIERLEDEVSMFEAEKPRAAKKCACEEIGNKDKGEEMSRVLGRIVFEENAMHRLVRQNWNPSIISQEQRKQIADVLTEIADHLRNDEFEVHGSYKKFPTNWTQE